jgi:hypothetical protein
MSSVESWASRRNGSAAPSAAAANRIDVVAMPSSSSAMKPQVAAASDQTPNRSMPTAAIAWGVTTATEARPTRKRP